MVFSSLPSMEVTHLIVVSTAATIVVILGTTTMTVLVVTVGRAFEKQTG